MKTIKANEVAYIKRLETDKQDRDRVSLLRIIRMDLGPWRFTFIKICLI